MATSIYALICTRSRDISKTTDDLIKFYQSCGIKVKLIVGAKSIFEGYKNAIKSTPGSPDDIFLMTHDDIKILMQPKDFLDILISAHQYNTGFTGVAGTTFLTEDCVWWNHSLWKNQKHSGFIFHGSDLYSLNPTHYGKHGIVSVLDGVFLSARRKILDSIKLDKPDSFPGKWDFYDLYYTTQSLLKGFINYTIPIIILHASGGEVNDRTSWQENRIAFAKLYEGKFPIKI